MPGLALAVLRRWTLILDVRPPLPPRGPCFPLLAASVFDDDWIPERNDGEKQEKQARISKVNHLHPTGLQEREDIY